MRRLIVERVGVVLGCLLVCRIDEYRDRTDHLLGRRTDPTVPRVTERWRSGWLGDCYPLPDYRPGPLVDDRLAVESRRTASWLLKSCPSCMSMTRAYLNAPTQSGIPCRSNSFDSRCRAAVNSPRLSSGAR